MSTTQERTAANLLRLGQTLHDCVNARKSSCQWPGCDHEFEGKGAVAWVKGVGLHVPAAILGGSRTVFDLWVSENVELYCKKCISKAIFTLQSNTFVLAFALAARERAKEVRRTAPGRKLKSNAQLREGFTVLAQRTGLDRYRSMNITDMARKLGGIGVYDAIERIDMYKQAGAPVTMFTDDKYMVWVKLTTPAPAAAGETAPGAPSTGSTAGADSQEPGGVSFPRAWDGSDTPYREESRS